MWDARTGKRKHQLHADDRGFGLSAAFTPDGRHVVVGYGSGGTTTDGNWPARMWRVADGKVVREFSGHKDSVRHLAISPDGKQLVTDDRRGRKVGRVWELETGKLIREGYWTDNLQATYVFSPTGRLIGIAPTNPERGRPAEITIGEPFSEPRFGTWPNGGGQVKALSPDGDFVAMLESVARNESQIVIRRTATGEITKGLLLERVDYWSPVVFSPNSQVRGCRLNHSNISCPTVHVFEMQTGREVRTIRGHRGSISALAFTPDGTRLATGSSDSTVLIWDLTTSP